MLTIQTKQHTNSETYVVKTSRVRVRVWAVDNKQANGQRVATTTYLVGAVRPVRAPLRCTNHNHLLHRKGSSTPYQCPQVVLGRRIGNNKVCYRRHLPSFIFSSQRGVNRFQLKGCAYPVEPKCQAGDPDVLSNPMCYLFLLFLSVLTGIPFLCLALSLSLWPRGVK